MIPNIEAGIEKLRDLQSYHESQTEDGHTDGSMEQVSFGELEEILKAIFEVKS